MTADDVRAAWDVEAAGFDDEPHHVLTDPPMREAWWLLLADLLPPAPARVADLGCGTGTIAVLLAEHGYDVVGVDLSPQMIDRARAKAVERSVAVRFHVGDAATPDAVGSVVDAVVARHVVWALPDPGAALDRWIELLAPGGRLVLIEGLWSTGAGLAPDELLRLVTPRVESADVRTLEDPSLWGGPLTDSRYAVVGNV